MKAFVTGASGKLGPFVIRDLLNDVHEVVLFSRKPVADEFSHLPLILGDINNFSEMKSSWISLSSIFTEGLTSIIF